jgi:hypothetical protein
VDFDVDDNTSAETKIEPISYDPCAYTILGALRTSAWQIDDPW